MYIYTIVRPLMASKRNGWNTLSRNITIISSARFAFALYTLSYKRPCPNPAHTGVTPTEIQLHLNSSKKKKK